jgi:DNA-binding protein Fis
MILARGGTILPEHLPSPTPPDGPHGARQSRLASLIRDWIQEQLDSSPESTGLYERMLEVVEPPLFEAVLTRHHGQFAAAARQLGLHRVTLKRKVEHYKGESDS